MNRFPVENIDKVAAAVNADNADNADNANKATKLANAKNIKLTGDVTGSASFDGTSDANITATVADDSHNHVISNIDNLQTKLDTLSTNITNAKNASITGLSISGKVITYTKGDGTTGTITTQDTNITYSNMTAATSSAAGKAGLVPAPAAGAQAKFLRGDATWQTVSVPAASSTTPKAAGTAAVGTATTWARADHVHPAQTTTSGNAGSATKLATPRTITIPVRFVSGGYTGSAIISFDGSVDKTFACSGCCTSCTGTCHSCSGCSDR